MELLVMLSERIWKIKTISDNVVHMWDIEKHKKPKYLTTFKIISEIIGDKRIEFNKLWLKDTIILAYFGIIPNNTWKRVGWSYTPKTYTTFSWNIKVNSNKLN